MENMKKYIIIFTTLFLLLLNVSCDNMNQGNTYINDTFDGNTWTFEVDPCNTTQTKEFVCKKGDNLDVTFDIKSGSWKIEVYKSGEDAIYKESNSGEIKKSSTVECTSDGTYCISITGDKLRGKFVISRKS